MKDRVQIKNYQWNKNSLPLFEIIPDTEILLTGGGDIPEITVTKTCKTVQIELSFFSRTFSFIPDSIFDEV